MDSQYKARKKVFFNVLNATLSEQKAICYSNLYFNIVFLKTVYSENLTKTVMAFA